MPLPVNPLSRLVSDVQNAINVAENADIQGAFNEAAAEFNKLNLDARMAELSGQIGTNLNAAGLNDRLNSALGELGGIANTVQSSVGGALGDLGGQIGGAVGNLQNLAGQAAGAISGLQSVAGSISNVTADISGALNKIGGGNLASGLMQAASGISKAAGMLNNLLSLRRGVNIPSGAELFSQSGQAIQLNPSNSNDWRVRITCDWSQFNSSWFGLLQNTGGVVWPYLPNITVSTKANYTQVDTIHNNYPFYTYKNSMVDDIQIAGEFSCENENDAAYWIAAVLFFKTATKMFYGSSASAGNPPIICNLSGYGSSVFDNVPIIVKSFSVDLKEDVQYIKCNVMGANTWVPTLSTITVTVAPLYNRARLRKFNIQDYASGNMTSGGVGFM